MSTHPLQAAQDAAVIAQDAVTEARTAADTLKTEVESTLADLEKRSDVPQAEQDAFDDLCKRATTARNEAEAAEVVAQKADDEVRRITERHEIARTITEHASGYSPLQFIRTPDASALEEFDSRGAPIDDVKEMAKRCIGVADDGYLSAARMDDHAESVTALIARGNTPRFDGDGLTRFVVATEKPAYKSAFIKGIAGRSAEWTPTEREAVQEARAMNIGTDTEGGYGVPVLIDPTIMVTNGQSRNPLINEVNVKAITTDEWHGVTSAQVTWSMDLENTEVSDDTEDIGRVTITTEKPQGFIEYTIEIGMDYPGFVTEMGKVLNQGYVYLVADQLTVGTGTSPETEGLFVGSTTTIDVATDNTFAAADIDAIWAGVPEDWRAVGLWTMNVDVENEVRGFGSGTATSRFTVDQTADGITLLNGRRVVLTDHAPAWAGTDAQNLLVFGDVNEHMVLVQRLGMVLDTIPHMMGTANNRPTGRRGIYGYSRFGSGVTVANAFRRLKNITT